MSPTAAVPGETRLAGVVRRHAEADAGRRAVAFVGHREREVRRLARLEERVAVAGDRRHGRAGRAHKGLRRRAGLGEREIRANDAAAGVASRSRRERGRAPSAPNASRSSAFVVPGLPDSTSAAIAARCGAAAEVPKNGSKPRTEVIDAVGAGEVGLLPHGAAGRGVVPGRDRRAVGVEEHAPRAVGCEALRRLACGEDPGKGPLGIGRVARLEVERKRLRGRGGGGAEGFTAAEWPRVTPGVTHASARRLESSKRPRSAETWK